MHSGKELAGRYRLEHQLGEGGMSVVWQAHDVVLRRDVAVKVLATQLAIPRQAIRAEALAASRISHPHVASVYDYGETPEGSSQPMPFLVMELLRGHSLNAHLADGPLPANAAFRIGAEVASALAAAHGAQVAHRDVKPSNVMLTPNGAKVIDFGIAASIGAVDDSTRDNRILGTPAYLAPERVLRDVVDSASDVYALGVLLYRMLTGYLPWSVSRADEMLIQHVYGEPAPFPRAADLPDEIVRLYNRCVAKQPADRPSAGDAHAVLAAAADLSSGAVGQGSPSAASRAADRIALLSGAVSLRGAVDVRRPRVWDRTAALNATRPHPGTRRPPPVAVPAGQNSVAGTRRTLAFLMTAAAVLTGVWLHVDRPSHGLPAAAAPEPPVALTPGTSTPVPRPVGSNGQQPTRTRTPGPADQEGSPAMVGAVIAPTDASRETTGPDPTFTPAPSASTSAGQTFTSSGGSVVAACNDSQAYLTAWEPAPSYEVEDISAGPADKAHVTFVSGKSKVVMTVTCPDSTPEVSIKTT